MKVVFIGQDLVGQGVQYATAAMARSFFSRGITVDVLVSRVHQDLLNEGKKAFELPQGVNLVIMPSRKSKLNILFLRKYLKASDADYVICESGLYTFAVRVSVIGLRKHPKLTQVNHWNFDPPSKNPIQRLKSWLRYRWLYTPFYAQMFVNDLARRNYALSHKYPQRLQTVYNIGVDDVFFRKVKGVASHPWLVEKSVPTFVTAGACMPYKGHMTLLRAMKIIKDSGVRARAIIFGRGMLIPQYEEYIKANALEDYVSVGGFTNNLPAEMKASDGFVLSSIEESFGIVLAEALACKIPVISTDAPDGPREVLEYGKYGKLVPVNDPQAMAEAIMSEIEHPSMPVDDEAWQRFTVERITDRYLRGLGIVNG